jgi:lipoprotein-anchoring transpeptidase ErfK/SrfK
MGIEGGVMDKSCHLGIVAALGTLIAATAFSAACADPFTFFNQPNFNPPSEPVQATAYAGPSDDEVAPQFRRRIADYRTSEAPGTIIVDTPNTYLYLVLGGGKALRYGIGVGREGFTWSGVKTIERKAEWPDWTPPPEMITRQPYLPRFVAGGPTNPLGARAMYLSGSVYRIHGTNAPSTIGGQVSSGCIRMVNEDVIDLYNRVKIGSKVVVLPMTERRAAAHAVEPLPGERRAPTSLGGIY